MRAGIAWTLAGIVPMLVVHLLAPDANPPWAVLFGLVAAVGAVLLVVASGTWIASRFRRESDRETP
jgi:hypothetical protein